MRVYGPVAQLVRAPPCHGGGRRFESVPGRDSKKPLFRSGFFVFIGNFVKLYQMQYINLRSNISIKKAIYNSKK